MRRHFKKTALSVAAAQVALLCGGAALAQTVAPAGAASAPATAASAPWAVPQRWVRNYIGQKRAILQKSQKTEPVLSFIPINNTISLPRFLNVFRNRPASLCH